MASERQKCRLALDDLSIWLEDASSIMLKAATKYGDPVELTAEDARRIVGRARALVELGYPGVREVLPEIFEWLKDGNWPVFAVLAPFVASLGRVIVPHVKRVLSTNDDTWKYWVLSTV